MWNKSNTAEVQPEITVDAITVDAMAAAEVVTAPEVATVEEPKTEGKSKSKKQKVITDTATATAEETVVPELDEKAKLDAMTTDELWSHFGGESTRGAVSKAIRTMDSLGFTRSQIATKLNKRYQHVRNVLTEPVKRTQ